MRPRPAVRRLLASALLGAALGLLPVPSAAAADPVDAAARKEITPSEARSIGATLAGPKFMGRGTGQKGNEEAARWLAAELRKAGLGPAVVPDREEGGKTVEGEYLQWFEVPSTRLPEGGNTRTANVVGVLRGTGFAGGGAPAGNGEAAAAGGSAVAEEVVVLGAHFDHLGIRGGDPKDGKRVKKSSVFWGADDNASGTTAALMIARTLGRLAEGGVRPRRTVVIAFFTGEEMGLLGSKHYVASPPFPVSRTVAMINLDMVGRNGTKAMEVYGNTSSPELDAWHREVLEETKMDCVYPPPDLLTRSDQWSFYEAGVPVLFLHGGLHKDYHSTRDTPDALNYPKVALIARHGFGVLWRAATEERRPVFRKVDMTGAGGKVGVAVDPCTPEEEEALNLSEDASAVRVTTVFAGSLGEKFFQQGDLIYSWNGFPLQADDPVGRFNGFVNAARPGDQVVIRFLRGKERRAVSVKL